jgi:hypothetical protein
VMVKKKMGRNNCGPQLFNCGPQLLNSGPQLLNCGPQFNNWVIQYGVPWTGKSILLSIIIIT